MANLLAQKGYPVLYVESLGLRQVAIAKSDLSRIWKRLIKFFKGSRKVQENLRVYSPIVLPMHKYQVVRWMNKYLLKWSLLTIAKCHGFKNPLVWTYNPMVLELIRDLGYPNIVYHSVDDLTAAPRLPKATIEACEKELIEAAQITFVTSLTLKAKYEKMVDKKIYYYPNVADYAHFSKARLAETRVPEDIAQIRQPVIGFIGAISEYKLDFEMIAQASELRPQWSFVLIGKVGEGDPNTNIERLKRPNVHLIGPRSYQSLPQYLKGFPAVIIPSPINEYTKSMFPMKFFEYLAAGKMIVSTDLPSLQDFENCFLKARTAQELVQQLDRILNGEVQFTPEMEKLAQEYTWESRLVSMMKDLDTVI